MHIAVLGATGRTGVPLVEGALQRGHHVRVLVRDRDKARRLLPVDHEHLEVVEGDAVAPDALERVVAGVDAVVDVTGPVKGGPTDLRGRVTRVLLPAMHDQGVTRLLFLTGAGVRVEGDRPTVADRAIRGAMQLLQPAILDDGQAAVAAVTASALDWTVVRVPRLTDGEPRGRIRTAAHIGGDTGSTLGRADLAAFLLDELERPVWSRQAPVVSW
jgi:putative NADH-flavin reductase